MLFNSIEFLLFFPAVVLLYYSTSHKSGHPFTAGV